MADLVEVVARAMSAHWRDMHTNESLGLQRMLARHAIDAMSEFDEGGLPKHLPMGVTEDGYGPADDGLIHHYVCWCAEAGCVWNKALAANRK